MSIVISEILPRGQSGFPGQELAADFLERWNWQAHIINRQLHALAATDDAVDVLVHEHFSRDFLTRGDLHLNLRGNRCLLRGITGAITSAIHRIRHVINLSIHCVRACVGLSASNMNKYNGCHKYNLQESEAVHAPEKKLRLKRSATLVDTPPPKSPKHEDPPESPSPKPVSLTQFATTSVIQARCSITTRPTSVYVIQYLTFENDQPHHDAHGQNRGQQRLPADKL